MKSKAHILHNKVAWFFAIVIGGLLTGCDDYFDYELPEANSKVDTVLPEADFSYQPDEVDFLTIHFTNLAIESTTFQWDFGTGDTSTELDPSYTYEAEGTYQVSLTASDDNGAIDSVTYEVVVEEPEAPPVITPVVLEADFEDNTLPDGSGDGRDSWRNDFGGVIQITGSPVQSGDQASKYPAEGDRIAYQANIEVSPNTDYIITYYYTLKTDDPGSITLTVIGGGISDLSEVESNKLVDFVGTDQTDADTYVQVSLPFNTGANSRIAILITNEGAEARLDNISIEPVIQE